MFRQPPLSPPIQGKPFRITVFITGASTLEPQGKMITETHWIDESAATIQSALVAGVSYANGRRRLLGSDARIFDVRVSQENTYRDALHDDSSFFQPPLTPNDPCDPAPVAVLVHAGQNNGRYNRNWFMGFLPDSMTIANTWTPTQAWKDAYANLKLFMLATPPLGWLTLLKAPFQLDQKVDGIAYGPLTPGVCTITCPAHGYISNDQVHFYRQKGKDIKAIQGPWAIDRIDVDHFTLRHFPVVTKTPQFTDFGVVRKRVLAFTPYERMEAPILIVNRKRGARTFLPRGRQPNRTFPEI